MGCRSRLPGARSGLATDIYKCAPILPPMNVDSDAASPPSPAPPRTAAIPRPTAGSGQSTRPCERCSAAIRRPALPCRRHRRDRRPAGRAAARRRADAGESFGRGRCSGALPGTGRGCGQFPDQGGIDRGGAGGDRSSRLVRNAHPGTGRSHQSAQSAVVRRLVRDRRARRTWPATAPAWASSRKPSDRWSSTSKGTCIACRGRTLARERSCNR